MHLLITFQDTEWGWTRSRLISTIRVKGDSLKIIGLKNFPLIESQLHKEIIEYVLFPLNKN